MQFDLKGHVMQQFEAFNQQLDSRLINLLTRLASECLQAAANIGHPGILVYRGVGLSLS